MKIKKLKEENENLKRLNYQYKSLKEKTDYLIYHLNNVLKKLPEFIQNIIIQKLKIDLRALIYLIKK